MKRLGVILAGTGLLALLMSGQAHATLPCPGGTITFPTGIGSVPNLFAVTGGCVQAEDMLFGNFGSGNLPPNGTIIFALSISGNQHFHELVFQYNYSNSIIPYTGIEYAVQVSGGVPGTLITRLDGDFLQIAGGPSVLLKNSRPTGNPSAGIDLTKTGAVATCVSGDTSFGGCAIDYAPGVTDLIVTETLVDSGQILRITDTIVETIPATPEPGTLLLLGAGLAGLAGTAWRRHRRK